jgi:hypothetical protein
MSASLALQRHLGISAFSSVTEAKRTRLNRPKMMRMTQRDIDGI